MDYNEPFRSFDTQLWKAAYILIHETAHKHCAYLLEVEHLPTIPRKEYFYFILMSECYASIYGLRVLRQMLDDQSTPDIANPFTRQKIQREINTSIVAVRKHLEFFEKTEEEFLSWFGQ
jgi:hypothetical protein